MGFTSILFGEWEQNLRTDMPGFFRDLQLDFLLERIGEMTKGYQIASYYYTLPNGRELMEFRQQIGLDMESETLCRVLLEFGLRLQRSRKVHGLSLRSEGEIQKATYHLQAAEGYWEAVSKLAKELETMPLSSRGMKEFAAFVSDLAEQMKENGFLEALHTATGFFSEMEFSLSVDPDKLIVEEETKEPRNYFVELAKLLNYEMQEKDHVITDIFPEPLELSYFESVLVGLLKKSKPQVFEGIRVFYEKFPVFYSETLLRFEEEVQFYLGFQKFKESTKRMGYPFCVPSLGTAEFAGKEVYDLALVWKHADCSYEVVSNHFSMGPAPAFFVVTGPNQGGKTTFARSVGQAVYFALMGLPVNAASLDTPLFGGISTHFEAEESMESNSGKLKEEINRLLPMLTEEKNRNHFVILNELFTTATTHDAMVMGRKVMEYFLERECHGIYVTHIRELAEETLQIISLVAQLEPGEETRRTYRILPMAAEGQGYSDALVKKYNLTYEEIVRRLT